MIFGTNKTVPLTKDIASPSTFIQSIGVTAARTDLDSIIAQIDQALANEITARAAGNTAGTTALNTHINNTTGAHAASAVSVIASGNQSGINAQTAINTLQTQIDLKATSIQLSAEIASRALADTNLQSEIDGERSPLRISALGSNTSVTVNSSLQTRYAVDGTTLGGIGVPSGSFQSTFPGANIDFNLGLVSYTGGTPAASSFTTATLSGQANKWTKYSIVLLPTAPDTVLVIWGGAYATTAAAVASPAFSGGVPIGIVAVQINAGATGIANVLQANLTQFLAGSGGGSGSGSGSPLDPQADENWTYYTRSDFSVDKNKFVDSTNTTGTDSTLGLGKVSMNAGQIFRSKDLTGSSVWSDAYTIATAQARLLYNIGKVDLTPSIQMSRDGGATFFTATNTYPSASGNLIVGDVTFPTSTTPLIDGGPASGTTVSGNRVAAYFTPAFRTVLNSFTMYVSTASTSGTFNGKVYALANPNTGAPTTVVGTCSETLTAGQDVTSTKAYKTFTLSLPITLTAGITYALSIEGTGATVQVDTVITGAPSQSAGSYLYTSSWALNSANLAYQVFGSGNDLRLKVTSSGVSELAGFGVDYVQDSPMNLTGFNAFEERILSYAEASTGLLTLTRALYTPGAHQLQVIANGHTFMAPDFTELALNQVQFPANYFQLGDVVRFYVGFGLVDSTSLSLAKHQSLYDAVVGSSAQQVTGVAAYSSLQSAINAFPNGTILVLKGYNTVENITIASNNFLIEGQGYQSQINGTLTLTSTVNFGAFKNLRFVGNVSIAANGCFIRDCYLAPTFSVTDTGTANSKLIIGE